MRILVFSDSHGYSQNLVKAINNNQNIDIIIHLGDIVGDAVKLRNAYKNIRVEVVSGNNDFSKDFPSEKILDIEGKRILITHGHMYRVKQGYQKLIIKGKSINADAVFFGHTHLSEELYVDNMLLLNPGSIGIPLKPNNPTYCLVEIKDGKISVRFCGIGY